ncbi:glycosyltransferase [Paenibacillus lautus]
MDFELSLKLKADIYDLMQSTDFMKAKDLLELYSDKYGSDPDIVILQSMFYFKLNDLEIAQRILEEGIKKYPLHEDLNYNIGFIYENVEDYPKSAFHFYIAQLVTKDEILKEELSQKLGVLRSLLKVPVTNILLENKSSIPKVSVIITAYNQENYLKQTIESLLSQTYPNIEIIVADDCSTDGTESMMERFSGEYRVNYKRNTQNLGPGVNGCHAFYQYADGEYVLFVNHDDYLTDSNYVLKAVCLLESNKTLSFVFANCTKLNISTGEEQQTEVYLNEEVNGMHYFMFYETRDYPHITSLLTSVFRRELLVQMECLVEETMSKDLFLYLKLMLAGNVGFIQDNVGVYRVHEQSISYNMPSQYDYSTIKELDSLRGVANKNYFSSDELMDKWLGFRIYAYFRWRFNTLRVQKNYEQIDEIMNFLSKKYNNAYILLKKDAEESELQ